MNSSGNDEQRWRSPSTQQRGQGQRRNMPRDGNAYSGQAYNQNSNGNTNAWASRNTNQSSPPPQQQQQQQQQPSTGNAGYYEPHVPVNGFNTQEAIELLARAYDLHVQAARAPSGPDGEKPIIYKGDNGWSTPKGNNSAWGQKRNSMATGGDFLVQLKKSYAAFQQNASHEQ